MINYHVVSDEDMDEIFYNENEEEIIRLMRWQEELKQQGKRKKADELAERIKLLEEYQREPYTEE